jgi:hypothetical protein
LSRGTRIIRPHVLSHPLRALGANCYSDMRNMKERKANGNSFPKIACLVIGAVIGIAIFKGLGIGGAIGGGLGGFLGACVGEFVYKSAWKAK